MIGELIHEINADYMELNSLKETCFKQQKQLINQKIKIQELQKQLRQLKISHNYHKTIKVKKISKYTGDYA